MAPPQSPLLTLPPELILSITDFVPADAIFALKLTHPILNNMLPTLSHIQSIKTLTPCTRHAIERLQLPSSSSLDKRCTICKKKYPPHMFKSSSSPACMSPPPSPSQTYPTNEPLDSSDGEIIPLPPFVCAWHVPRLTHIVFTGPGGRNEWISGQRRMCMHAGCIEGWVECTCGCMSCGVSHVQTYTRFLSEAKSNENERVGFGFGFGFWRDGEGILWVREVRGESVVNLEVVDEANDEPRVESRKLTLAWSWFQQSPSPWYRLIRLVTSSPFLYTMRF